MENYVRLICKQNPTMTIPCPNPDCKHGQKHTFKTADVLSVDTFEFKRDEAPCKIDAAKIRASIKKQLDEVGLHY